MGEFEDAVVVIDRRGSAAATASGFAIAIGGLMLRSGSRISPTVSAVVATVAFGALLLLLVGQVCHLGRTPARPTTDLDVQNACALYVRKEAYTQAGAMVATASLLAYAVAFLLAAW
jgi:hypothetical protein